MNIGGCIWDYLVLSPLGSPSQHLLSTIICLLQPTHLGISEIVSAQIRLHIPRTYHDLLIPADALGNFLRLRPPEFRISTSCTS